MQLSKLLKNTLLAASFVSLALPAFAQTDLTAQDLVRVLRASEPAEKNFLRFTQQFKNRCAYKTLKNVSGYKQSQLSTIQHLLLVTCSLDLGDEKAIASRLYYFTQTFHVQPDGTTVENVVYNRRSLAF